MNRTNRASAARDGALVIMPAATKAALLMSALLCPIVVLIGILELYHTGTYVSFDQAILCAQMLVLPGSLAIIVLSYLDEIRQFIKSFQIDSLKVSPTGFELSVHAVLDTAKGISDQVELSQYHFPGARETANKRKAEKRIRIREDLTKRASLRLLCCRQLRPSLSGLDIARYEFIKFADPRLAVRSFRPGLEAVYRNALDAGSGLYVKGEQIAEVLDRLAKAKDDATLELIELGRVLFNLIDRCDQGQMVTAEESEIFIRQADLILFAYVNWVCSTNLRNASLGKDVELLWPEAPKCIKTLLDPPSMPAAARCRAQLEDNLEELIDGWHHMRRIDRRKMPKNRHKDLDELENYCLGHVTTVAAVLELTAAGLLKMMACRLSDIDDVSKMEHIAGVTVAGLQRACEHVREETTEETEILYPSEHFRMTEIDHLLQRFITSCRALNWLELFCNSLPKALDVAPNAAMQASLRRAFVEAYKLLNEFRPRGSKLSGERRTELCEVVALAVNEIRKLPDTKSAELLNGKDRYWCGQVWTYDEIECMKSALNMLETKVRKLGLL